MLAYTAVASPAGPAPTTHVVDPIRIDWCQEPDAPRELRLRWIAQHGAVGTQHDREIAGIRLEPLEQGLRFGVHLGIEALVRMPASREESLEPQHIGMLRGSDEDRSAAPGLEKSHPPEDERAHDPLAELGFLYEQLSQPIGSG